MEKLSLRTLEVQEMEKIEGGSGAGRNCAIIGLLLIPSVLLGGGLGAVGWGLAAAGAGCF